MGALEDLEPPPLDVPIEEFIQSANPAAIPDTAGDAAGNKQGSQNPKEPAKTHSTFKEAGQQVVELVANPPTHGRRASNLFRETVYRGILRRTIGVQTDTSELQQVTELQRQLGEIKPELLKVNDELENIRVQIRFEQQAKIEGQFHNVKEVLQEKLSWAREEYDKEVEAQRSAHNSMLANSVAVLQQSGKRAKEQAVTEVRRACAKDFKQMRDKLNQTNAQMLSVEADLNQRSLENNHLKTRVECMKLDMETADHEPLVRQLRGELAEAAAVTTALRDELRRRQQEISRGEIMLTKLRSESAKLEECLAQEQAVQVEATQNAQAEAERLRGTFELREKQLLAELETVRGKLGGLQTDYRRECQVTDILHTRQNGAIKRLQAENVTLHSQIAHLTKALRLYQSRGTGTGTLSMDSTMAGMLLAMESDGMPLYLPTSAGTDGSDHPGTTQTVALLPSLPATAPRAQQSQAQSARNTMSPASNMKAPEARDEEAAADEGPLSPSVAGDAAADGMQIDGVGFRGRSRGRGDRLRELGKKSLDEHTPRGKDVPCSLRLHDKIQSAAAVRNSIHQYQVELSTGMANGFSNEHSPATARDRRRSRFQRGRDPPGGRILKGSTRGAGYTSGAATDRSHHHTGGLASEFQGLASFAVKAEPSWLAPEASEHAVDWSKQQTDKYLKSEAAFRMTNL